MSLNNLRDARRLQSHQATQSEIHDFILKAQRALHDARVVSVSVDSRFVIAYHGALSAATAALAAAGYRPTSVGHHQTVFEALPLVNADMSDVARFLDACRRRRHQALYGRVGQVTENELADLLEALEDMIHRTKVWLTQEHPQLYSSPEE